MAVELENLRPYTSLTLSRVKRGRAGAALLAEILQDIEESLGFATPGTARILVGRGGPVKDGELRVGYILYREERTPRWSNDQTVKDVLNQLVLVCLRKRYVAILLSDPSRGAAIGRRFDGETSIGLSALQVIEFGVLNAAFAEGPARTLWLSGIHRRTPVKADSKILTGADLRDALDPLGDQSYYFTAARCMTDLGKRREPVGVSPRRSRIWTGPSRSWKEFREGVQDILKKLESTDKAHLSDDTPLPVLAAPVFKVGDVKDAFDMNVIASELLSEEVEDADARERLERWSYNASFNVVATDGPNLVAEVFRDGESLGRLNVGVDLADPRRVRCEVTPEPGGANEDLLEEAADVCRNRRWLQIRYESGHTLSDGTIYSPRFRDVRFTAWKFPSLAGVDISKEKPTKRDKKGRKEFNSAALGKTKSLFCWVWNNWPSLDGTARRTGWLACDDGSMEIADFIHFDERANPPLLSLMHVKGSGSAESGRGISVSDYEVVTAQAIKNLRHVDREIVALGLEQGLSKFVGTLVWHNGVKQKDRKGMLAALRKAGENYARRIVVIQPRVSRSLLEAGRAEQAKKAATGNVARLRQLETLLVAADGSCRTLGTDFLVVPDGTPQPEPTLPSRRRRVPRPR
jgi:hypothetical protein